MSPAPIRRVGIVFSGGPAPAAHAVISAAALRFIDDGIEVIGLLDGYRHLQDFRPDAALREGEHFLRLTAELVSGIRTLKPILLRTSHADPSAGIACLDDLADPDRNRRILAVHDGLEALGVDALVSVGGDETLRTANHLLHIPDAVPGIPRVRVVHLPKTIDNDYFGIDWTFGFTSAVDFAAREIRNIGADAQSTSSWFVLELMGRQTGWLTYASGIAGEATKMISVEDIDGEFDVDTCGEELALLMEARARATRSRAFQADRLRGAVRGARRLRRHARKPAGRGRSSCAGDRGARWGHGVGPRAARARVRAVRGSHRSGDDADPRPIHRSGLGLLPSRALARVPDQKGALAGRRASPRGLALRLNRRSRSRALRPDWPVDRLWGPLVEGGILHNDLAA